MQLFHLLKMVEYIMGPLQVILGGAVYENSGKLVVHSQRIGGINGDLVSSINPLHLGRKEINTAKLNRHEGRWLYIGNWMNGFGHFIMETLSCLWPLIDGEKVVGVCANRFTSKSEFEWQRQFFDKIFHGVKIVVVDEDPASFEELIVPTRLYNYQNNINSKINDVWKHYSDFFCNEKYGKLIYFSNSKVSSGLAYQRKYLNSQSIDEVFDKIGFLVVNSQEISVHDQIGIAANASIIAGPSGSALHLSAFQKSGAVIELGDMRLRSSIN